MNQSLDVALIKQNVIAALAEDIGDGCLSTAILEEDKAVCASIICREGCILAGSAWASAVFHQLDANCQLTWHFKEGDDVPAGSEIVTIVGKAKTLLQAERTALNFLQTLSGTATVTRIYCDALEGTNCRLLDTRKTIPGLRYAQKYATRMGGAMNHRMGLYDAFLIKENHIKACGSIEKAIMAAKNYHKHAFIEVEVESLDQLKVALLAKPHRIMLDNFNLDNAKKAVLLAKDTGIPLEFSGNVSLEELPMIAKTGVDYVSVGAITKHLLAVDLSLLIKDA